MRILLINQNDTEREMYRIYLENTLNDATIYEAATAIYACNTAMYKLDFDAVLWFDKGKEDISLLFNKIKTYTPATITVIYGDRQPHLIPGLEGFKSANSSNGYIPSPLSPRDFCLQFLKIVSPSRSSLERVSAFQKIRLVNFYRFNRVLCPIYLQLADKKFVKIFNTHAIYQKSDIDKYRTKGVDYFYIANSDFEKFNVTFSEQHFLERIENGKETLDYISATHLLLKDLITNIGVSDSAVEMANNNITAVKSFIDDNPGLSSLFMHQNSKENYGHDHSHLVAIVCCNIFHRLHWDTTDNLFKLCAASVFHDLYLDHAALNLVEGKNDPRLQEFSAEEVRHYLDHPEKIAKELEKIQGISSEVIDIVRYHHEDDKGEGFYHLPPSRLSTMTATFIVAHRYIHLMYQHEFDPRKNAQIITQLKQEFKHQIFSNIITAFDLPALHDSRKLVA